MYIQKFLSYLEYEKRYSIHTINSYSIDINQFQDFLIKQYGDINLTNVDYHMVRYWIVFLVQKKISNRSVCRKISSLRSFYKYLNRINESIEDPMMRIVSPKQSKKLPFFIEENSMRILLEKVIFTEGYEGERDKLIIDFFYMTGIRISELLSIKIHDIDFNLMSVKILGKRNKQRVVPLTQLLLSDIQSFCEKYLIKNFIFTNKKQKVLSRKQVYNIVNKYLGQVSSNKSVGPHVLRHTFATHMLNNGADINTIKEILGHANLSATQIYTHNSLGKLKEIHTRSHPRS
ncbi:MAG: integrase [Flavobacteriales bacterium]|nr:integrase [Flavobacteriales bacterium]